MIIEGFAGHVLLWNVAPIWNSRFESGMTADCGFCCVLQD